MKRKQTKSTFFLDFMWMSDPEGCSGPSVFHQFGLVPVLTVFTQTVYLFSPSAAIGEEYDFRLCSEILPERTLTV